MEPTRGPSHNAARPPFIWTPRQPIAENYLLAIKEIPVRDDGKNRWFLFRTVVDLANVPLHVPTHITVDGRYLLFVNGKQVGRGPVRCSPLAQRFDTYDIAPSLKLGRNVVSVLAHTYGVDTAFHEGVRGLWSPVFGEGGLWIDGDVVDTRRVWRCMRTPAWVADVPQANHSLGFIEWFDARLLPADWTDADFDDSDWDVARPLIAGGGGPESMYQGTTVRPFPILVPRGIPDLRELPVRATTIRWVKGQRSQPGLPIERRLYEEVLEPVADGAAINLNTLLREEGGTAVVRTFEGVDTAITLDFGRILSGYPCFEIHAKGGETIEIACTERLPGEWFGDVPPDARVERRPHLGTDAHLCRYVARPGAQRFQRFEWCAIRYMHIVVRDAPDGITFRQLGAVETHYPVEEQSRFSCSDPILTKLWAAGADTLKQCMHDAWEDCPSREQRQWLGDVTIENVAAWAAFGGSAAALTAKYLIQAAESQRPDGLTQMFAPGDHGQNARLIPDWTLQWILCAADHWHLTGDLETMDTIWPSIQKALGWFERLAFPKELVVDMPYWHFMDWAGLGREGQALALNAQLAGALIAAATIGRAVGSERSAKRYEDRATRITTCLDATHWDEIRGVWVDMVDPRSGRQDRRTSQHGVAALVLWGNPNSERVGRALDWATEPSRETATPAPPVVPFGNALDEDHGVVVANTFYSHFVGEALVRHGRSRTALDNIRRRFGAMIEAGSTTLWEAMTPWASLCHGFSASPTYFLSRHVLGVAPAAPGFARIVVRPDLMDLDHAEGAVCAGRHLIEVRLVRTDRGFDAKVTGDQSTLDIEPAAGFAVAKIEWRAGQALVAFEQINITDGTESEVA